MQWVVPPQLVSDIHQWFPAQNFIFPIEEMPEFQDSGSYGAIWKVNIAKGHLEYPNGIEKVSQPTGARSTCGKLQRG
jgi:hypothetical protein